MAGSTLICFGVYLLIRAIIKDYFSSDEDVATSPIKSKKEVVYLIENHQINTTHESYYFDCLKFDNTILYCNKYIVKKQYNKVIRNKEINADMALRAKKFLVDRAEYLVHLN